MDYLTPKFVIHFSNGINETVDSLNLDKEHDCRLMPDVVPLGSYSTIRW